MKNNPLVSIIVNCCNGEKYLRKCLDSIINQTFSDFELIFWDNNSKDNSHKIFQSYKDERFKYFKSSLQTTLYKARNEAIKKTQGSYICFLDVDDYWLPKKIEKQIDLFNKKENIDIVYTNQIIYEEEKKIKKNYILKKSNKYSESEKILDRQGATILTALFKKKAYHNLDYGFNENYNIIGDLDLFFRMSKNSIIEYIDEPLAVYRLHKSNYSKLNKNEEINELREWYKNIFLKISNNQNEINIIKNAILLREIIFMILNQKRIKSISKILLYKNSILKLKLVMAILIPNFILKKYLKF